MRIIYTIVSFAFIIITTALANTNKITFTNTNSGKILQLEKELAFFYGAKQPELVANHYIKALTEFEKLGINAKKSELQKAMLGPLTLAYEEVKNQTNLNFNSKKAAKAEFQLIIAQAKQASFEEIRNIMVTIYEEVFNTNNSAIQEAAMLRTFLYMYKINILKKENTLTDEDIKLMLHIAKVSEDKLISRP